MKVIKQFAFALIFALVSFISVATAEQGTIDWRDWTFTYNTNNAVGLELNNVHFKNRKILQRASFPVMRVEYDNDVCGPFGDILWQNTLQAIQVDPPYDSCNGDKLCGRTYTQNGSEFLELGINAKLGEYEIYQSFIFSPDGYFDSYVFSRGLQCVADHRHHAHWLFDFDIDGQDNDQILKNSGDLQTSEFNDRKDSTGYWTIRDAETGLKVEVIPGDNDGFPDNFSQWDVAARKWKPRETGAWLWGARAELGNLFNDSENIDRENIVFWYISHLEHAAVDGIGKWHVSGPRIKVVNP